MSTSMNSATIHTPDPHLLAELPMLAHLKDSVRELAVSIAQAMGDGALQSSRQMSTAIAIARDIVSGRYREKLGGSTFVAEERSGQWLVRRLDSEVALASFSRRTDAIRRGLELASRYDVDFILFGPKRAVLERHARQDIRAPWMDFVKDHLAGHPAQNDAPVAEDKAAVKTIQVGRDGRNWVLTSPDGHTESHRTKKAALAAAEARASELSLEVVVA